MAITTSTQPSTKQSWPPTGDFPSVWRWIRRLGLLLLVYLTVQFFVPSLSLTAVFSASDKLAWYISRSSGTVAYLLLSASTIWGLLLSSKLVRDVVPAFISMAMHSYLSWLAIGLSAFHAFILLFDRYYMYTITDLFIPFSGPYRPGWVGLGVIGLYIMLLTSGSFAWRQWLGYKIWRMLHYFTFVAYVLVTVHGLMAGTDSGNPGMSLIFFGSGLLIFFLTIYRILAK